MQINTKTLLTIGGILAAGAITAIILKKRKSKKDFEMPPQEQYKDPNASTPAPQVRVTPPWSPAASAQALYDSMNGAFYTDEDLFFGTSEALTASQRQEVQTYFNANLGEGSNLCEWIEGDFSFGSEDKALALYGHQACTWCWSAC